jgi:SagB-type dehydrogenase family enzyme
METSWEGLLRYHEKTKHHPHRYARSAGFLDWASEPDPFRRYEGTPLARLSLLEKDPEGTFTDLFDRKGVVVRPFSLERIACFLQFSLGFSAWKSYGGNSWALRMNPSSGNLHPVEGYLILPPLPDGHLSGGVYHYSPFSHGLEMRVDFDQRFWSRIMRHFPDGFFFGLSSIHWRESWKYGERAFRYSHLDMGHAIAALSFSAALLGWKVSYLNALSDHEVETVLGFTKTRWREYEGEEAGPLLFVHEAGKNVVPKGVPADIISSFESLSFEGQPNRLSSRHRDWSVIDEVSGLTVKPPTREETYRYGDHFFIARPSVPFTAADVIRKRRSALAFDGETALPADDFFSILDMTLPRNNHAPFDAEVGEPSVHLLIFVHRVIGLEPGLYFLYRGKKDTEEIRRRCRPGFLWERTRETPETLPLYVLERGDFRSKAAAASCDQDIAGGGAFAVAMIAEFQDIVERQPHQYRHLHWEAGMIGQVL